MLSEMEGVSFVVIQYIARGSHKKSTMSSLCVLSLVVGFTHIICLTEQIYG